MRWMPAWRAKRAQLVHTGITRLMYASLRQLQPVLLVSILIMERMPVRPWLPAPLANTLIRPRIPANPQALARPANGGITL